MCNGTSCLEIMDLNFLQNYVIRPSACIEYINSPDLLIHLGVIMFGQFSGLLYILTSFFNLSSSNFSINKLFVMPASVAFLRGLTISSLTINFWDIFSKIGLFAPSVDPSLFWQRSCFFSILQIYKDSQFNNTKIKNSKIQVQNKARTLRKSYTFLNKVCTRRGHINILHLPLPCICLLNTEASKMLI